MSELVVYLYKYNNNFVPENPQLYGEIVGTAVRGFLA